MKQIPKAAYPSQVSMADPFLAHFMVLAGSHRAAGRVTIEEHSRPCFGRICSEESPPLKLPIAIYLEINLSVAAPWPSTIGESL
jgi:hypothetical protein